MSLKATINGLNLEHPLVFPSTPRDSLLAMNSLPTFHKRSCQGSNSVSPRNNSCSCERSQTAERRRFLSEVLSEALALTEDTSIALRSREQASKSNHRRGHNNISKYSSSDETAPQ